MGPGDGPKRGRPFVGPPGEERPPYNMGPPAWGPPPPGGWGPPPHGGWGPPLPDGWGPPPLGVWPRPPEEWGPPPPGGWGPRGPPPPDCDPRGPPPPGWGPHPNDWMPPPEEWIPAREHWRHHADGWRPPRDDWPLPPEDRGPHPGWVPGGLHNPWGPEPVLPVPPPEPTFGPVPPLPPPGCVPPYVFSAFPPPPWTGEPVVEEPMLNPPPEQPEWIKALISAPPTDSTPTDPKKSSEESPASEPHTDPLKPKTEISKVSKDLCLLGRRTFEKPPPGRSTGIISFVGPTFGYIEREDLEKFTFSFDAFFGNPKAMLPGVRVHFTACKEKNSRIATDVKVAPGGTENMDMEIFEAVVSKPIQEPQPGERQYPGQVNVNLGPLRTNLKFERTDSSVTLLKDDQVLLNVLSDIVTKKRRATNIRPKIPSTFSHTKETRLKGSIASLDDSEGVICSDEHGELPFEIKENFSDIDFTSEDAGEEVVFTVMELKAGKRAIRIQRLNEPLLLTLCTAKEAEAANGGKDNAGPQGKLVLNFKEELLSNLKLDPELYEGIVSQPIIEPTLTTSGYPGQISANIGPLPTNVTFDHRDCSFTLLKNDHVLINLLVDTVNNKRRAANIRPKIPFTFTYTKEIRAIGVVSYLGGEEGVLKSDEHGELPFDLCENFSDNEFTANDINTEVEFTTTMVKSKKRAIRLRRMKRIEDLILLGQKKRREEEEKRKREEQEREREAERKKKEEVTAALAAAKDKWTPLGFTVRDPASLDDISKERFEGTILRAIFKMSRKEIKKETEKEEEQEKEKMMDKEKKEQGDAEDGEMLAAQVKTEGMKQEHREQEVKEEKLVSKEEPPVAADEGKTKMGRLVMTVDGQQKLLSFSFRDVLTTATMLDGDKVRFNIATNRETKEERATFVEILPDSFEESIEQRRHGIVIEFYSNSGLIKCTHNPQLYFHMSEVIEKKKLELNEKVEFSVVPHETAEGGHQAIRIKRFTESVFLPARKLSRVGASKGKMTIKLTKPSEDDQKLKPETDKLKAVVKTLRAQDSKTNRRDYSASRRQYGCSRSQSRTRSRSQSRSPPRDQFGRVIKKKCSPSIDRDSRCSRHRRSREPRAESRHHSRKRSKSRSRSSSSSSSRSRDKERSKDKTKKRSKTSRECEDRYKRRREATPPPRHEGVVDDELAKKKRELEELNEMIAYKKSLVEIDPRGSDHGQRTCIDYDHGRIAVPLTEYKPVRSILKKQLEGPEYPHRPSYEDPYYSQSYSPYKEHNYRDSYTSRSYPDRLYTRHSYGERLYENHRYGDPTYGLPDQRYTDRYDVYDEQYEDRYCDSTYSDRLYDLHDPTKQSNSAEHCGPSPPAPSDPLPSASPQPPSHTTAAFSSSSQLPFRPPSPIESPPRSPSPKPKFMASHLSPLAEKPPLDRFLDMLNKKTLAQTKPGTISANDMLLPHERARQDGKGFSQIVGLAHESPCLPGERSSSQSVIEEPKAEPYDKIQNFLRTIGLKLGAVEVTKLASRAQEKLYSLKSSSTERDSSCQSENPQRSRTGSVESDHIQSLSSARSSSLEPLGTKKARAVDYEGFLNQQGLEVLKRAQDLHSLTKTMEGTPSPTSSPKPPPMPPPAHPQHPPPPVDWPLGIASFTLSSSLGSPGLSATGQSQQRVGQPLGLPPGPPPQCKGQSPPGPPPGPPPRRPPAQPLFTPLSGHAALPFLGQTVPSSPSGPCGSPQPVMTSVLEPLSPTLRAPCPSTVGQSAISTTVARCLKVIETVKSLAVQPSVKPVKSVQFSLPTEASLSTGIVTSKVEDEVTAKQKEKLDLYNLRMMEKREKKFKEMLSHKKLGDKNQDGCLVPPGKLTSSRPKNVWICGHSLVYWAESRAKSPEVGMQLGMDSDTVAVWWKGTQGMTWSQLLPQLHQLKVNWPNPDVLIVHLGGNDLSTESPTDLLASVRKDLTSMRNIFPHCFLVWSNILPRRVWRHSADNHEMDLVRTTVNRRIQNIVSELGGTSLSHDNIRCGANTGLYRPDGVHLSPKGIDLFNLNLQDFLEKWDLEVNAALQDS